MSIAFCTYPKEKQELSCYQLLLQAGPLLKQRGSKSYTIAQNLHLHPVFFQFWVSKLSDSKWRFKKPEGEIEVPSISLTAWLQQTQQLKREHPDPCTSPLHHTLICCHLLFFPPAAPSMPSHGRQEGVLWLCCARPDCIQDETPRDLATLPHLRIWQDLSCNR